MRYDGHSMTGDTEFKAVGGAIPVRWLPDHRAAGRERRAPIAINTNRLRAARYASSLKGLNTLSPGRRKSRSFPVAIVRPWRRAVAAM